MMYTGDHEELDMELASDMEPRTSLGWRSHERLQASMPGLDGPAALRDASAILPEIAG